MRRFFVSPNVRRPDKRNTPHPQVHVANPSRMAELTGVAFDAAQREVGPVQLNIPRDFFYGESAFFL